MRKKEVLKNFLRKYIEGTPEKAIVADRKVFLCSLTKAVMNGISINTNTNGVYVTTRCLKHLFDKKPAEEFLFLIDHLHKVVKYPDRVYKNKSGKRGEYCFVKLIGNSEYFCSIEIIQRAGVGEKQTKREEIQIATAFRLRDRNYLKNYILLWSWGDDDPHRSALDTP